MLIARDSPMIVGDKPPTIRAHRSPIARCADTDARRLNLPGVAFPPQAARRSIDDNGRLSIGISLIAP
ncbi:hypothetical protein [Burkholderia multivorans]|uniref:hypothetical protein n=1 Tax=Burkholderia multivorans TaxID=87883 RepID=UPI0011B1D574|nr:hypothetical protein [Burkholderia multivorans]